MKFEKVYSCQSKMTIRYNEKDEPVIDFKFSYTRNVFAVESDYDFFKNRKLNKETTQLLLDKGFIAKS